GTTTREAFVRVLGLVTGPLGGTVHVLTDDVHDEATALISHVPHVLATELLGVVADAPVRDVALGLAAGSFRDATRVGRTDPRRTEAMVTDNAAWVASALRVVVRDLEQLVRALETNAPVGEFFDRPEPVRAAAPAPVTGERRRVEPDDAGAWRSTLAAAGARGGVVVAVEDGAVEVACGGVSATAPGPCGRVRRGAAAGAAARACRPRSRRAGPRRGEGRRRAPRDPGAAARCRPRPRAARAPWRSCARRPR